MSIELAYADHPQPIGLGQTISQPTIVALMSQAIELDGPERVLEIGTGSGYQAAILAVLAHEVFTIEIVEPLGQSARARLAELGYSNVHVRIGDGYAGWPDKAPFDRILLTASPPEIPQALVDQLADGGVIVAPVGPEGEAQRLVRWKKRGTSLERTDLGGVRFVPMVRPKP
jgi:protein-L-isoaspartate(D-aspartate) O-methyltransferase